MTQKKILPTWLSVLMVVLLAVAFLSALVTIPRVSGVIPVFTKVMYCIAYIAALFYNLAGYKKNAAGFYKAVCIIYTVTAFMSLCACLTADSGSIFLLCVSLVALIVLCVLTLAEDLGRTKSFVFAGVNVLCSLIVFAASLGEGFMPGLAAAGEVFLALVFGIMVYAKYAEKTARGRTV